MYIHPFKKHISIVTYRYYHFFLDHQRLLLYILANASPQKLNTQPNFIYYRTKPRICSSLTFFYGNRSYRLKCGVIIPYVLQAIISRSLQIFTCIFSMLKTLRNVHQYFVNQHSPLKDTEWVLKCY